jgi:uncharacterized protein DUF1573
VSGVSSFDEDPMTPSRLRPFVLLFVTFAVVGTAIGLLVSLRHAGEAAEQPKPPSEAAPAHEAAPASGPRVAFASTTWRLDGVFAGEKVEHRFAFRNAGSEPLDVLGVKSTCGCTVADASRRRLEPGESSDVHVTFDTKNRGGDVHKAITVSTNDPREPHVALEITGRVLEECWGEPATVELGDRQRGETPPATRVRVLAKTSRRVEIVDLAASDPGITFTKTPVETPDAKGFDLDVHFASLDCLVSRENPNLLDAWIDVTSTSKLEPTKRVRLVGQIVDDVLVEPGVLTFKPVARGEEPELTATLHAAPAVAIRPSLAAPRSHAIDATLEPIEEGRRYRVRVKVRKDAPVGRFRDTLAIKTGTSDDAHLHVEIFGEIKP